MQVVKSEVIRQSPTGSIVAASGFAQNEQKDTEGERQLSSMRSIDVKPSNAKKRQHKDELK